MHCDNITSCTRQLRTNLPTDQWFPNKIPQNILGIPSEIVQYTNEAEILIRQLEVTPWGTNCLFVFWLIDVSIRRGSSGYKKLFQGFRHEKKFGKRCDTHYKLRNQLQTNSDTSEALYLSLANTHITCYASFMQPS